MKILIHYVVHLKIIYTLIEKNQRHFSDQDYLAFYFLKNALFESLKLFSIVISFY